MSIAQAVVHTTGVNWESTLAIVGSIVAILSVVITALGKLISNKGKAISGEISASIDRFRIEVVNQLDTRLTRVESTLDNINRKTR